MKITRRLFSALLVIAAPLLAFSYTTKTNPARDNSAAASLSQYLAFIGTYTNKTDSKGIYSFRYDAAKGQLTPIGLAAETSDPSWVAISENGKFTPSTNSPPSTENPAAPSPHSRSIADPANSPNSTRSQAAAPIPATSPSIAPGI